ncbi:MAG: iron ABC transporter permease [Reyranella sp.]|uniref:ABC transporter permease n=1 Tax=Reyranella sp. TaxID=1929291 RepID=UPI001AD3E756|nr:iron ABC transporter permease [Reyranella sp.]MBN9089306.1 iron ABC transporter permease [Reyranella sp.]
MATRGLASETRRLLRDPALLGAVAVLWLLLAFFVLYPVAELLVRAFSDEGRFTLEPLLGSLADSHHRAAFVNSLILAGTVGVLGTLLGFLFAMTATRAGLGRRWLTALDAATLLPLVSPPFTISIAIVFSFGPKGFISHDLLGLDDISAYGFWSTALAETLTYFPIAYLTLRPIIAAIDSNLEEMAFSLGGSRWRIFRTVTVPLAVPGFANAFLLLFAASLADFATPLILAGNSFSVLPTQAYLQITGMFDFKGGAVLSLMLLVPAAAVYLLQRYWVGRRVYVTVTGKVGQRSRSRAIAPWAAVLLAVATALVAVAILYFYALLLYASVVVAFGANNSFTWQHYHVIFTEGLPAIRDTLIIALIGMPLGGLYGVLVGYLIARRRFPGRQAMEIVSMINYALPGTIVGIAYLIAFNDPPVALTGGALIIVACYVFRYSPTGIRATVALLQQIDRSLEEASASLGAGSGQTFRRVTLPLIAPAFFAGLGVVFIRSMTAISATIFLVSLSWTLITVRILENMTELALGPAAAFSVFVIVVVFAVVSGLSALLLRLRTPMAGAAARSLLGG